MTRDKAIQQIESLYPADAEYPDTVEIGRRLLARAKEICSNWRNEPDAVIFEYLNQCLEYEKQREKKINALVDSIMKKR